MTAPPNSTECLEVQDGRIIARVPFFLKEVCKGVPGAKWDGAVKAWMYDATPLTAETLDQRMPMIIVRTDSFKELLATSAAVNASQAVKTAEDLPPVPVTMMPAWLHQLQAYWYAHEREAVMLAMDMGTGKTKVTLDVIQNSDEDLILIVAPNKVVASVWPGEIEKHMVPTELVRTEVLALAKKPIKKRAELLADALTRARARRGRLIAIINYESVWREPIAKQILGVEWDRVVLDESHRIKSPQGRASKYMQKLGRVAKARLCLTGTPMPHSPLDIFGQYRFLDPSIFGTAYWPFKETYGRWGGFENRQLLGIQNEDELHRRFDYVAYKVGKEVLDLPPVQHITRHVEFEPAARRRYASMEDDFVSWLGEGNAVTADNALVKLLRMQQMTSGYLQQPAKLLNGEDNPDAGAIEVVSNAKREELADLLEDLPLSEPLVIFSRFALDLDVIRTVVQQSGRTFGELSGRRDDLAAWKEGGPDAPTVLGVQIQAGGTGIDLTRARYCIYYSTGYSLGDYEQSLARVHRPGQTRPTVYYHLRVRKTVDDVVAAALTKRKNVVTAILNGDFDISDDYSDEGA